MRESKSTFVLVHRAPHNYTGSPEAMAAWNAWFEHLGANLVDRGNPVFERRTVGNCGAETALGGYTLITAADLEAAIALARGCPIVEEGGGVEVGELTLLNSGLRPLAYHQHSGES
jgi:hypothetical protein